MKEEMIQILTAVMNTLEQVSVSGKRNWENMRNSVAALEQITARLVSENVTVLEAEAEKK